MNLAEHSLETFKALPTIQAAKGDELKYDGDYIRIWLCADNSIDVECWDSSWGVFKTHSRYKVGESGFFEKT